MGRRNFIFIPASTYAGYTPTSNTKLLYYLRTNSTDYSGNGNTGTDTDITYSGGVAVFNGTTSYIKKASPTGFGFGTTGSVSISCWVKTTNGACNTVSNRHSGGSGFNCMIYGNTIYADGGGTPGVNGTTSLITNVWRNLIYVWDRAGAKLNVYVDGVYENQCAFGATTLTDTSDVRVGSFGGSASYLFSGSMGEVIIENIAWNQTKITNYFNESKTYYKYL